ncbi:MAG: adenylate/guanylate cyclase domain-containing protein [Pseudomonadota bacterium]
MERHLAAILAADLVGYSALMGADEAGTLARVKACEAEVVEPLVSEHKGRIVKRMGDGYLVEFASVVAAVECALAWQEAMAERAPLRFRIGINLGEIITEDEDIYGTGVNVAARLEALADPGGICLSGTVYGEVKGKIDTAFEDLGSQTIKNIAEPVRAYRVASGAEPKMPLPTSSSDLPTIAVLPFTNMSGDPEQQYFSDGISEDIITELARFGVLQVVARNSTFVYRDQSIDVAEIGRLLGCDYLLEGSLRKAGKRIRLTAQLIDAKSGKHVWAERYDRDLEDIFAIQDELVHAIVTNLVGRVATADLARSLRKPAESLAAYDLYLRALELDRNYDEKSTLEGVALLERAVELDPRFARAHVLLATFLWTAGWFKDMVGETYLDRAIASANRAISLDPDDALCHGALGSIHLMREDYGQAGQYFERALSLNAHDTMFWTDYGWFLMAIGESDRALEILDHRETFEPHPPLYHWEVRGQVLYALRRYEDSMKALERSKVTNDWVHANLAACYGQLGRVEEARASWATIRDHLPNATLSFAWRHIHARSQADRDHWEEGLEKAGISD